MLIFRELAIKDVDEAYNWYENQKQNLGEEFLDELQSTLAKIEKQPKAFQKKDSGYRSLFLNRFPLEVVYRELGKRIFVLRIYHGKRNPKTKIRGRKK